MGCQQCQFIKRIFNGPKAQNFENYNEHLHSLKNCYFCLKQEKALIFKCATDVFDEFDSQKRGYIEKDQIDKLFQDFILKDQQQLNSDHLSILCSFMRDTSQQQENQVSLVNVFKNLILLEYETISGLDHKGDGKLYKAQFPRYFSMFFVSIDNIEKGIIKLQSNSKLNKKLGLNMRASNVFIRNERREQLKTQIQDCIENPNNVEIQCDKIFEHYALDKNKQLERVQIEKLIRDIMKVENFQKNEDLDVSKKIQNNKNQVEQDQILFVHYQGNDYAIPDILTEVCFMKFDQNKDRKLDKQEFSRYFRNLILEVLQIENAYLMTLKKNQKYSLLDRLDQSSLKSYYSDQSSFHLDKNQ